MELVCGKKARQVVFFDFQNVNFTKKHQNDNFLERHQYAGIFVAFYTLLMKISTMQASKCVRTFVWVGNASQDFLYSKKRGFALQATLLWWYQNPQQQ